MKKFITLLMAAAIALTAIGCSRNDPGTTEPTGEPEIIREAMGTITETVLYDTNGIKVTATSLEQTINGGSFHVTIENTTQQPICLASDDLIINGLTVTDGFSLEAAAGSTATGSIDVSYRSMDNAHITNIAYIESPDMRIFETIEFVTLDTAAFRIETSIAADYAQVYPEAGNTVYDKNGVIVQILGLTEGERITDARLLVTNNTDTPIAIKCENPTADGEKLTTWMFDTVYAGTSRYCFFEFSGTGYTNVTAELDLYSIGTEKVLIAELGSQAFTAAT